MEIDLEYGVRYACAGPHGRRLLVTGGPGQVHLLDIVKGEIERPLDVGGLAMCAGWSAEGTEFGIGFGDGKLERWTSDSSEPELVDLPDLAGLEYSKDISSVDYASDGRLVIGTANHNLVIGGDEFTWSEQIAKDWQVSSKWGPSGLIYSTDGDNTIQVSDPQTGKITTTLKGPAPPVHDLGTDDTILYSISERELIEWDLQAEAPLTRSKHGLNLADHIRVAANDLAVFSSKQVAVISRDGHAVIAKGKCRFGNVRDAFRTEDGWRFVVAMAQTTVLISDSDNLPQQKR